MIKRIILSWLFNVNFIPKYFYTKEYYKNIKWIESKSEHSICKRFSINSHEIYKIKYNYENDFRYHINIYTIDSYKSISINSYEEMIIALDDIIRFGIIMPNSLKNE